jgi:hypothetical protein
MNRLAAAIVLSGVLAGAGRIGSAIAGDYGDGQVEYSCYQCVRDAIYDDITLIDRLEADPDLDEGTKGPQIAAAHADIHRLRKILGPFEDQGTAPCCYTRPPLFIR